MAEGTRDEKAIFLAALEKTTPQERNAFVEGACAGDPEMLERVIKLLESHDESVGPLDSPPPGIQATIEQPITEKPGTVIGPYKLLQKIGEGGFGVVYMADQTEPVKRRVALKIIKPGMDTRQVIARFEAERQALAMMDHPNIAKVLDAGTTESGRPYFVMELVKGVPITQYCDEHHLTPRERLELFVPVCQAIQHAHQKGVIHRDIKPTNVLVGEYDDRAVPRIIDFGVAKATEQRLTDKTMFTQFGQILGTVDYMSPEQAKLNEMDIDTRSDVYSLGVLLYELLTGETPFDRRRLRSAAFDELLRIIREEEPPKPSLRLTTSESLPSIAANRHTEPKKLSTLVRGELDWIVMKALEKDRARRYETANGFANDIQRYLDDEPVVACPPSVGYRFRKFARRNKAPLAVVSVAALVLIAVAIGAGVAAARFRDLAQRNANLAMEKQAALTGAIAAEEAATKARDQEAAQREEAERQTEIARDALADAERQRERAEENFALARSAVDEFLNQVTENELLTVPGLQPLREELLSSAMEFYDDFTEDAANASELQVELAAAHHRIAVIRGELGQTDESEASNAKSIELFEQFRDAGVDSLEVRLGLANAYFRAKRYDDTVALCQRILETDSKHSETRSLLAGAYNSLALAEKNDNDDMAAALEFHQQALALREGLVQDFPDKPEYLAQLGGTVNNLGVLLGRQGKNREALAMFERGVGYSAEAYHNAPQTIRWGRWLGIGLRNVALKQARFGNQQEALQSFERLVAVRRKLAFENPAVPSLKGDLYKAYLDLGNYQKKLGDAMAATRSLRAAQEVLENIPNDTPDELFELAAVYGALATPDEGTTERTEAERDDQQRYADLAMEMIVKAVGEGYRNLKALQSHKCLAAIREREDFRKLEKEIQAEQLAAKEADTDEEKLASRGQAVDVLRDLIGTDSPEARHRATLATTLHSIGEIQIGLGQYAEAEESLQEVLETRQALLDEQPDNPQAMLDVLAVEYSRGRLHWAQGEYAEAHRAWQACLDKLLAIARTHREDQDLQQEISIQERKIFQHYGRCGLFPLVRDHAARSVEFDRVRSAADVPELASEGEFSAVVLVDTDGELARGYFRQLADSLRDAEYQWTPDLIHLVRGIAAIGANDLLSEELLSPFQSVFDERSDKGWWIAVGMAMVHYRRGQYTEAQSVLESLRQDNTPQIAFLDAAIASKLGDGERAHERWSEGEARYGQICRDALVQDVADNDKSTFDQNWWQFAYDQAMRRLASETMSGEPAPDDPWQHLIQARGYWLIGEKEKAEGELAASIALAPQDTKIRLARARLFAKLGEEDRAEADWQKVVELAGDDPMPWIRRGRWYAERGEQEKAEADFAKAASLEGAMTEVRRLERKGNGRVGQLVFAPNGRHLVCAGERPEYWDLETGKGAVFKIQKSGCMSAAVSPDGSLLATGHFLDGVVRLWSAKTGEKIREFVGHRPRVRSVAFSPDGRHLLSGSHAGQTARLWDTGTAKEVWRFHCRGPNYSVAFSPDGDTALVSDDSLVRLVEVESGKEIASTAPSPGQVKCAAFSPCGRFVVSGKSNGIIQVWDAKSGRQTRRFAGHRAAVRTVQFLPDGRHIISGSEDKTLRLWEVQTGQEVARFEAESCCTTHVTVSPDGRYAASGGGRYQKGDGEVVKEDQYDIHLWRLPESVWPKDVTGISEEPAEAARPEEKGMYDRLRTEAAELLGIEVEAEKEEQEQP